MGYSLPGWPLRKPSLPDLLVWPNLARPDESSHVAMQPRAESALIIQSDIGKVQ